MFNMVQNILNTTIVQFQEMRSNSPRYTREVQTDNSDSDELPEGQFYVEKLLAQRRKVYTISTSQFCCITHCNTTVKLKPHIGMHDLCTQHMRLTAVIVNHPLSSLFLYRDQEQNTWFTGRDILWELVLGSVLQTQDQSQRGSYSQLIIQLQQLHQLNVIAYVGACLCGYMCIYY